MNFATFDLNLMRVLNTLLREQSTVKAGKKLGLSQPAVSSALSRLRFSLDDQLLVRRGNKLVPTDFAREISLPLSEELDRLERLFSRPEEFDPFSASEIFQITASDFFAEMLMPPLARYLCEVAPGIKVQLVDLMPDRHIGNVEQHNANLALIPDEPVARWADMEFLFSSRFAVIARKNHPLIGDRNISVGEPIPMDLFCELKHVLFSPAGSLSAASDAALAQVGRQRDVVMTLHAFSGVCQVVSQSELVALVPWQLGKSWADPLQLEMFIPPVHIPANNMIGVWHKRSTNNPAHRWIRNTIFDFMKKLEKIQPDLSSWPQNHGFRSRD